MLTTRKICRIILLSTYCSRLGGEEMKWLTEMRVKGNLSQIEVAKKCAISRQYYNFIENGLRRPSPEVAKRIADVLGFGSEWYRLLEIGERANKKPANAG